MLKFIFKGLKKIVSGAFILYGYNLIAGPLDLMIPINIINVLIVGFLGVPALIGLVIFLVLIF